MKNKFRGVLAVLLSVLLILPLTACNSNTKDPKVTVIAGSEKCYLFVKLEEKRSNVKPRPVRVAPVVETAAEAAPAAETAETAPAQAE